MYRGIDQYIKFNSVSGAGLTNVAYVIGGEMRDDSEILEVRPLNDWRPVVFSPLGIRADGTVNFVPYDYTLLNLCKRDANGDVTAFDIEGGVKGAAGGVAGQSSIKHMGALIDTMTLELNPNSPMSVTVAWKAKYRLNGDTNAVAYPTGLSAQPLLWSQCVVGGSDAGFTNIINDMAQN